MHAARLIAVIGFYWSIVGCATSPYRYGDFHGADADTPQPVAVEQGKPHKTLDRLARIVGWPKRIVPMDRRVNSHELSPETLDKLSNYLEKNDLADVHVYINHYDPRGQWKRLRENDLISPAWRYTVGSLSMLGYTLLPNRVFGGDHYNAFTNSLYLNSDVAAIALDEAAIAKDIHARRFPGTYAVVTELPVVHLLRQGRAISDVLSYARDEEDWEVEKQAYRVLYARMGADGATAGASFWSVWWGGPVVGLGGAAIGHVAGHAVASRRETELARFNADVKPISESPAAPFDEGVRAASFLEPQPGRPPEEVPSVEPLPLP
jgi:hypothetical protein